MYVILTSKPGQFHTELVDGLDPVESYDYMFYGRRRAHFVIAQMSGEPRVRVIDDVVVAEGLFDHLQVELI